MTFLCQNHRVSSPRSYLESMEEISKQEINDVEWVAGQESYSTILLEHQYFIWTRHTQKSYPV